MLSNYFHIEHQQSIQTKRSICTVITVLSSRCLTWFSFVYVGAWQPFDEDYLNHLEPPVKHMSFHAYIRKLTGGADK